MVVAFCLATICLIPLDRYLVGGLTWVAGVLLLLKTRAPFRAGMGLLFGGVLWLALAPISTDRSTAHFLHLGAFLGCAVAVPALLAHRLLPGAVEWRLWPHRFAWRDVVYVGVSVPIAYVVIRWYFFVASPEVPANWPMPDPYTEEGAWRLILGINGVGIWDELFFVNIVYGILRTILPKGWANVTQAVVYTSVLNAMAFTGVGPIVVYVFALTQGVMYERQRCLLYVLIVHLIVDAVLVGAIMAYHYPGRALQWL